VDRVAALEAAPGQNNAGVLLFVNRVREYALHQVTQYAQLFTVQPYEQQTPAFRQRVERSFQEKLTVLVRALGLVTTVVSTLEKNKKIPVCHSAAYYAGALRLVVVGRGVCLSTSTHTGRPMLYVGWWQVPDPYVPQPYVGGMPVSKEDDHASMAVAGGALAVVIGGAGMAATGVYTAAAATAAATNNAAAAATAAAAASAGNAAMASAAATAVTADVAAKATMGTMACKVGAAAVAVPWLWPALAVVGTVAVVGGGRYAPAPAVPDAHHADLVIVTLT
jgi:hypothetical protein